MVSVKSFEGSRVSTAGSAATIGWAGPWVVTHRQNGPDRMYPAKLRPGAPKEPVPHYVASRPPAGENGLDCRPVGQHCTPTSQPPAPQPVSVEWMLPERQVLARDRQPQAALLSSELGTTSQQPGNRVLLKRTQGIPSMPTARDAQKGSIWGSGSQIPSPVRKPLKQPSLQESHCTSAHDEKLCQPAAVSTQEDRRANPALNPSGRGERKHAMAQEPPFWTPLQVLPCSSCAYILPYNMPVHYLYLMLFVAETVTSYSMP